MVEIPAPAGNEETAYAMVEILAPAGNEETAYAMVEILAPAGNEETAYAMVEILAPAGNEETAYASLNAGANAIYLGLREFSARASAENFDLISLARVCTYAHLLQAKVYVCLNTLIKDSETQRFFETARLAYNAGADALLIQDIFLGKRLKELYPELTLHLSTQGGCCNKYGALLAKEYGFSRVVLARETPLADMKQIASVIETETFVQGALCSCFSGQCYFSSFAGNHSGNRGRCKQPCRKKYVIDRTGYDKMAYALSLSDLSLGENISDYLSAGVSSLKIEGRMRRPEYAAAAVKYYRALLNGVPSDKAFSAMKRIYNRGDYTKGLAFGQDDGFLSRRVQGHIGEAVGRVAGAHGDFCKSDYLPRRGDAFKILRRGAEVGGASFLSSGKGGFYLSSAHKLMAGDAVYLTTSEEAHNFATENPIRRTVTVSLDFTAGKKPSAQAEGLLFEGEEPLQNAVRAPLTREEIDACFQKTDTLPLRVVTKIKTENAFLSKAKLNEFRRAFYVRLCAHLAPSRTPLDEKEPTHVRIVPVLGALTATIGEERGEGVFIKKCSDYRHIERGDGEAFLYLPPLFTEADERAIQGVLDSYRGIYCEGYYGILLAKKYHLKLFAGAGMNIANRYAVEEVRGQADYFVLSKELSGAEQRALSAEGAFHLAGGAVKLMDLCYCPFEGTCERCDRRDVYTLKDEAGRAFPLRRYRLSGTHCRFELYNCLPLSADNGLSARLIDESVKYRGTATTKGHFSESVL